MSKSRQASSRGAGLASPPLASAADPLSRFIYGQSIEKALFISSQDNELHAPVKLFDQSSRVDVVNLSDAGAVVQRGLRDPDEIKAWLDTPPISSGASARFLFLDACLDAPDRLPVTEEILKAIFRGFGVSSRFFDLLSRQHMPGRQVSRPTESDPLASPTRHEIWWSAVLRSQVQPGVIGPLGRQNTASSNEAAQTSRDLSRNVAYWQRFALWSDYTAVLGSASTATYLVLRCPLKLKHDFLDSVEAGNAGVMLQHPLGPHAFLMEHIVRETYDMAASFSVPLYQWENFAEMETPEDYTRRSRAFLTLARQMHQITTDHDILTASVNHLVAESRWLSELAATGSGGLARSSPALQSAVDDILANLVKEVGLISTYMVLYLERSKIGVSECYALINQRDSEVNIKMGAESAAISRASVKDNESLRIIQIMSMVFLPGSFVASIFGMGFFTTDVPDDGGSAVFAASGSWWIYFAVAVPLTVCIILGMQLWPLIQRRKQRGEPEADSEAVRLAIRTMTVKS